MKPKFSSVQGAFNYTGAFFWPFAEKITVTSISMPNDHFVDFFISFHVGLTYLELFYYNFFSLQFWGFFCQKYEKISLFYGSIKNLWCKRTCLTFSACPYIWKSSLMRSLQGAKSTQSLVWVWKGVYKRIQTNSKSLSVIFLTSADTHHFLFMTSQQL